MNAKARKKSKRKDARIHLQGQATHEQASKDEAASDDAARNKAVACDGKEPWSERSRSPQRLASLRKQIHWRIAAYLVELVDDIDNDDGDEPASEREKLAIREFVPEVCAQMKALIDHIRTRPEEKLPKLKWSLADEGAAAKTDSDGTTDEPLMTNGEAMVAQASNDDAVTTKHHPDPAYNDLWTDVIALVRKEMPPDVDINVVHEQATKIFRVRKRRLKAKAKKGHDQHVVALKDISNVKTEN